MIYSGIRSKSLYCLAPYPLVGVGVAYPKSSMCIGWNVKRFEDDKVKHLKESPVVKEDFRQGLTFNTFAEHIAAAGYRCNYHKILIMLYKYHFHIPAQLLFMVHFPSGLRNKSKIKIHIYAYTTAKQLIFWYNERHWKYILPYQEKRAQVLLKCGHFNF